MSNNLLYKKRINWAVNRSIGTFSSPGETIWATPSYSPVVAPWGYVNWSLSLEGVYSPTNSNSDYGVFDLTTQFCQQSDIGLSLVVQLLDMNGAPYDITDASNYLIKATRPDGTIKDFSASLYTDGSDGKIVYVTGFGDLSQFGYYNIQGKVVFGNSYVSSSWGILYAYQNVDSN